MKHKIKIIISIIFFIFISGSSAYLFSLLFFYSGWLWENDYRYIMTIAFAPFVLGGLIILLFSMYFINKKHQIISKKRLVLFFKIFPILVLVILFSGRLLIRHNYNNSHIFTTERWENTPTNDRFHLIPSFEKQYDLVGEDYETVLLLLGDPDVEGETYFMYFLGYGRGIINIDILYYSITFDENLIVTKVGTYQS